MFDGTPTDATTEGTEATPLDYLAPNNPDDTEAPQGADGLEPKPDRYHITDLSGIEWYFRKLSPLVSNRNLIAAQSAAMLKQLDNDIAGLTHLYEAEVNAAAQQILDPTGEGKWPRGKSLHTFWGSVSFKACPGGIRMAGGPDAKIEEALAKATQIGAVVQTLTTIDEDKYLEAAAAALEETGELWPGLETYDPRESPSHKFGEEKPPKSRKPRQKASAPPLG